METKSILLFWNLAKRLLFIFATFTTRMRKQRNREPPAIFFSCNAMNEVLYFSNDGRKSQSVYNNQPNSSD